MNQTTTRSGSAIAELANRLINDETLGDGNDMEDLLQV